MEEKTIAFILIRDGLVSQRTNSQSYSEANDNVSIKNIDKNTVKEVFKFLKINKVVADYQSTFGEECGYGFAFKINTELIGILQNDELIWQKINNLFKPINELVQGLTVFINTYKEYIGMEGRDKEAILMNLQELNICYSSQCYFACLALCNQIRAILKDDIKPCPAYRMVPPANLEITIPSQFRAATEILNIIHTLKAKSGDYFDINEQRIINTEVEGVAQC